MWTLAVWGALNTASAADDRALGAEDAKSAEARGDIAAARAAWRQALLRAERDGDTAADKVAVDALWTIDSHYGPVDLNIDPGVATLEVVSLGWSDAVATRAIDFARSEIDAVGRFEGYLPAGQYRLAASEVVVEARTYPVHVDLRTAKGAKVQKKLLAKRARE